MCLFHGDITHLNKLNITWKVCVYTCTYKINSKILILEIGSFPQQNFSATSLHEQPLPKAFMTCTLYSAVRIFF